ncbi:MAG TPA: proline dehydrogenase family protein [Chloroflexia bacterium]|nr:proline dehydrogenase family protein [Chloroflexia bacterium]
MGWPGAVLFNTTRCELVLRQAFLTMSNSRELQDVALHNAAARRFALRFVAGETLDQAVQAIADLNRRGITATFDQLGENVDTAQAATAAADSYIRILERIGSSGIDSNVSLKLTQMGLDVDEDVCFRNVARICEKARESDNFVRIDMESSAYTDRTLQMFRRLWHEAGYKNVGVVLQAYLYRTEGDVREMNSIGARVRLCKGAYNEAEDVAFPKKADVDANYAKLTRLLLTEGNYPGIATHDARLIEYTKRFAASRSISPSKFEFQMLYGIRREMQVELVKQGYNMRVYVPYGKEWYPYFMRRLAERPANMMFVLGNLVKR